MGTKSVGLSLAAGIIAVVGCAVSARAQATPYQGRSNGNVRVNVRTADGRPVPAGAVAELIAPGQSPRRARVTAGPAPFAFQGVERGPLTITIEAPGYIPISRFIDHRGGSTSVSLQLLPLLEVFREPDISGSRLLAAREWVIPTTATPAARRRIASAAKRPSAEAISTLQKERAADPDFYATHNNLGVSYLRQGLTGHALQSLYKAVELAPKSPVARRNLGLALLAASRHEEAAIQLSASAQLSPSLRSVLGLGEAYYRLERFADAADRFGEAARLGAPPAWVYLRLGQAHLSVGDREAAVPWLKRYATTSEPGADSVRRWLVQLGVPPN